MRTGRPVTLEGEALAGAGGVRRGGGEGAAELLAVDRDGERASPLLCAVALIGVFRDIEDQRVRTSTRGDRRGTGAGGPADEGAGARSAPRVRGRVSNTSFRRCSPGPSRRSGPPAARRSRWAIDGAVDGDLQAIRRGLDKGPCIAVPVDDRTWPRRR